MKRVREAGDDAGPSTSRAATSKKPKAISACVSCKKHKTRCEILDPSKSPVRCHRCQVLSLQCSYEETMVATAPPVEEASAASSPDAPSAAVSKLLAYPPNLPSTDRLWSFVDDNSGIDWSAPMLAIQQLSRLPLSHLNAPTPPPLVLPPGELTLTKIIPDEQVSQLLNLFDERYTPWLNFHPARSSTSPLLDIACCAIAARHLDNTPTSTQTKMLLQKLTEDWIAKVIINPRPYESVESIQALLILSLWAPLGGPGSGDGEGRDGRLLVASSVSMAMNLRLNQASGKFLMLRKKTTLNAEEAARLTEAIEHARLWIALTNTESMLCLGTGRIPLSRRSPEDLQLIQYPKDFNGDVNFGDMRLGLAASAFDLLEESTNNRLQAGMDVDDWYDTVTILLEKMKRVRRLIGPLPYVLDRDQFYFHMLHLYEAMSHLTILYYAMSDARASVGHVPLGQSWHQFFRPHGMEAIGEWGREMVVSTERMLTNVLAADTRLLGTAPDNIFTMVALSSGYLVGVKFLLFRGGTEFLGGSDLILARIVTNLGKSVCGHGHAAQRAALLVRGMLAKWEAREKAPGTTRNVRPPAATGKTPARARQNNPSPTTYPAPGLPSTMSPPDQTQWAASSNTGATPPATTPGSTHSSGSYSSSYPTPNSDSATGPRNMPSSDFMELSAFTDPSLAMHPSPNSAPQDIGMGMDMSGANMYVPMGPGTGVSLSPIPDIDFGVFMDSMSLDPEFWNALAMQSQFMPPGYE
ncbi:hypothetical protein MKEN_00238900 [Mycena kentingensis (nom. inval.)]|nr:hypothetical protein MKEN_00238900 [Mycena kentingensis (nom. inval.)]